MHSMIIVAAVLLFVALPGATARDQKSYLQAARTLPPTNYDKESNHWHQKAFGSLNLLRENNDDRRNSGGRDGCSVNYNFDYLLLSLQWGPGACSTSPKPCAKYENKFFTIHGMWPQSDHGEGPEFCCANNSFYYREIEKLVPDLNRYWISFYGQDNTGFWSHEWLKHGTCASKVDKLRGELYFFGTTLNIVKSLQLVEVLAKDNILPGPGVGTAYDSSKIIDSLRQATGGVKVAIKCDKEHDQPTPVLTGLGICFNRDLAFIDCPTFKRCQGQVLFRSQTRTYGSLSPKSL